MASQSSTSEMSATFGSVIVTTPAAAAHWTSKADRKWQEARERFLAAVAADQQAVVDDRLDDLGARGAGLRTWLTAIAWRGAVLPQRLPRELVQAYLDDAGARPLHECDTCGLLIPIRPARRQGSVVVPAEVHFSNCPACDGQTGWYVFRSKASAWQNVAEQQHRGY